MSAVLARFFPRFGDDRPKVIGPADPVMTAAVVALMAATGAITAFHLTVLSARAPAAEMSVWRVVGRSLCI